MERKTINLLLVEDDPDFAVLISELLETANLVSFKITQARSLDEAFHRLDEIDCDAILLDLGLPDSQGLGTLLCIYEHSPETPIIVMTGNNSQDGDLKAIKAGAQDFIIKGAIDGESLARSIFYATERQSMLYRVLRENARLGDELAEHRLAASALTRHIEFENIITTISTSFIQAGNKYKDYLINTSLEIIGKFSDIDRSYLFLISDDGRELSMTNEWDAPGIETLKDKITPIPVSKIPIAMNMLKPLEPILISTTSELPAEALSERELLYLIENKSVLVVPLCEENKLTGFIGYDSLKKYKKWSDEDVKLLKMIGETITHYLRNIKNEELLINERNVIRNILEYSPDSIIIMDLSATITDCNQAALEMHGYNSKDEILGKKAAELVAPEDRERSIENGLKIREKGKLNNIEYAFIKKDGSKFPARLSAGIVLDANKNPVCMICVAEDITDRKNSEETIKKISLQNKAFLDNLPDLSWMKDRESRFIAVNAVFHSMFGVEPSSLIGKTDSDILPAGLALRYRNDDIKVLETGTKLKIEEPIIGINGEERWIETHKAPLFNDNGEIYGTVGVARDITEKKRMLEEISDAEEKFYLISSLAADAIILINGSGLISFWNHSAEIIFGHNIPDAIGQNFCELLVPEKHRQLYMEFFNDASSGQENIHMRMAVETVMIKAGKHEIHTEVSLSSIQIKQRSSFVITARDITRRKAIEAELQKAKMAAETANLAKSEFLANMSHEIRTPMTSIIGMIDLLTENGTTENHEEYASIIKDSAKLLINIINDILDISKIEAGKVKFENISFEMEKMVMATVEILSIKAHEKKLKLSAHIDPGARECFISDPGRIQQVLLNLIGNAIKFTDNGEIKVSVTLAPSESSKARLYFEVSDTGIGMSEEQCRKLFEPFYQGDMSNSKKYGGTGLGLALSKRLIELMNGRIGVASKINSGSKFWFTLELERSGAKPAVEAGFKKNITAAAEPISKNEAAGPEKKIKILLAEDNAFNQKLIKAQLTRAGYEVSCVDNGSDAIIETISGNYSMVLMDCHMPIVDGYEASKKIRELELKNGLKKIPIVALTADAMEGARENCILAGMDDYFVKPIEFEILINSIRTHTMFPHTAAAPNTAVKIRFDNTSLNDAPAPKTGGEHIDLNIFSKLKKLQIPGKPDIASELIDIFLCDTPPKLEELKGCIDRLDPAALRFAAHGLKSSCANIGAVTASIMCREMEEFAKTDGLSEANKKYALKKLFELIKEYETVSFILNDLKIKNK